MATASRDIPTLMLPAVNGTLTEEELRELEEQRLRAGSDELVRAALPAILGTPERLGGPAGTPPFVPSDVGAFEPSPRPGSRGNPFPPLDEQEDPNAAIALGFRDLAPSSTNGNRPPENLLAPRQPSPELAAAREEQARQATPSPGAESITPSETPVESGDDGSNFVRRFVLPAVGGLALGSAIRNRDIGPLVQGATGFFTGQQAAEQRRADAAREAEEQAFRRAPKISVDTEFGSVSGIPLPSPTDAEGLGGVEGAALEMALREYGIPKESIVRRADYQLLTDGLGNVWRVNRATGDAESVTGPEGAPTRRQVIQIPGSPPLLIDPTDPTAPAIPIPDAPAIPLSGAGRRPTEGEIGRGLRSEGLRLVNDALRELGVSPQQMREGSREDREAIWLQWRDWLRGQEGFAGADPRLLDSIIEEVIGPRELDTDEGGGGLQRLLEQLEQGEGGGAAVTPDAGKGRAPASRGTPSGPSSAVPSSFHGNREGAQRYAGQINAAASKYGIPPDIAFALVQTESNFDPRAKSEADARGLTQVLPSTARDMGYDPGKLTDPATSLDAGFRYLADQFRTFGDWETALLAYHSGPGNVRSGKIGPRGRAYVPLIRRHGGGV